MARYSIKDLEHLSGIKAHTLRIWEQRYSLINPKRTETNIRYYDQEDLKLVLNVSLLKENGYKISKIAEMQEEDLHSAVMFVAEKTTSFADQVYALTLSMIDMDEQRFEKIISSNTLKLGFERTMLNIIYPFLSKIGIMWTTDAINPAQEHFMSHLIRQKLIVAIDGQIPNYSKSAKKFMLYLPENELHEISLLFASFLIQSREHRVIYLGQNMPFHDLHVAHDIYEPDYLFTILTSRPDNITAEEYLNNLSDKFPNTEVWASGSQVIGQDLNLNDNIVQVSNPNQLAQFLENTESVSVYR